MKDLTIDFLDYKTKGQIYAIARRFERRGDINATYIADQTRFARMRYGKGPAKVA